MEKNDFLVIAYKIMAYLQECMKAGKQPDAADIMPGSALIGSIPLSYWTTIMDDLLRGGYISGAFGSGEIGGTIKLTPGMRLMMKGAEYMAENNAIRKAGEYAGASARALIQDMVAALIQRT